MDRFKEKLDKALEVRGTRDRIVGIRAQKAHTRGFRDDDLPTEDELVTLIEESEHMQEPEQWQERRTLLEYDLYELDGIDAFEVTAGNSEDEADYAIVESLLFSLTNVKKNNFGNLRADQRSYVYSGDENGPNNVHMGKIDQSVCVLDSKGNAILTPFLDAVLKVTNTYIDATFQGHRIRITGGEYLHPHVPSRDKNYRYRNLHNTGDLPGGLQKARSVRVSILEPIEMHGAIEVYEQPSPEIVAEEITLGEIEPDEHTPVASVYPAIEGHKSFDNIQEEVFRYLKTLPPTARLKEQLEDADSAIQLPAVFLDNQSHSLALRTSPTADILFFYNSSLRTDQDRVADVMHYMTTEEFLELGNDDERRERLLHDTLAEKGFFLIRQHDGEMLLMDRDIKKYPIVTADSPFFLDLLGKAEDRLVEYFAALDEQAPETVPLRDRRRQLAAEMEANLPRSERTQKTMWQKVWHWLIKP